MVKFGVLSTYILSSRDYIAVMTDFLTSKENIVINLLFEWLGEKRCNRTLPDYKAIAARVPKLDAVFSYVSQRLGEMAIAGDSPYAICYFKLGDQNVWFANFPAKISRETVRTALKKFWGGLRP
jgi:hypothetical protein